jgi:AraC-like DNA-binding protein
MRALELEALTSDAVGVYVRHRNFVYVVSDDGLHATLVCGAFDEAAATAVCAVWGATAGAAPHPSLFDVSMLVTADVRAFGVIQRFLGGIQQVVARDVHRQAIVCGPTLGAALVLGFYTLFPPPFPIQTFERRGDALTRLGAARDAAALERVAREVGIGVDVELAELRARLDRESLVEVTLATAARWLGITPRTLQRRLAASRTEFSDELSRARVARAQRLMLDRAQNLTTIALDIGCSSPSTFSELFRRITGETPTAWRRRHLEAPDALAPTTALGFGD